MKIVKPTEYLNEKKNRKTLKETNKKTVKKKKKTNEPTANNFNKFDVDAQVFKTIQSTHTEK